MNIRKREWEDPDYILPKNIYQKIIKSLKKEPIYRRILAERKISNDMLEKEKGIKS